MPTRVQTALKNQQFSVNSISKSFTSLPSAGNFIVVYVATHAAAGTIQHGSVTDNQGNAYLHGIDCDPSGISPSCAIFYAENIGSPSGTFTVTFTPQSNSNCVIMMEEWSGMGAATVTTTHANNSGGSTTPNTGATGSVTPPATGSLVCAVSAILAANTSYVVDSVSPAWTKVDQMLGVGGSNQVAPPMEGDSRVVTATGTQSCGWTSDVSGGWSAGIVVFASNITRTGCGAFGASAKVQGVSNAIAVGLGTGSVKVTAPHAMAISVDGGTNNMTTPNAVEIFGDFIVTGNTTFSGSSTQSSTALSSIFDTIVTADGDVVVDDTGNVVFST